jgi:hypothetical protein
VTDFERDASAGPFGSLLAFCLEANEPKGQGAPKERSNLPDAGD